MVLRNAGCKFAFLRFFLVFLAACSIGGTGVGPLTGGELVLVRDGESLAPIIVSQDLPPETLDAAEELAEYMERISGAAPEVITERPDPVPERAIWVGYTRGIESLFPELNFDFEHPEEILISANESHLVICGRDVKKGDVWAEYGSVNAVYTFLQDYLDVRWIWPGELGIDIIERDSIAFPAFEYRYHPQIRARSGIFVHSKRPSFAHSHDWVRVQRIQLDSLHGLGGHGFPDWWEKFHKTNPEYFALQPDGSRGGGDDPYPGATRVKMCKSNPALWDQWIETNVEKVLEAEPHRQVFDASANDSSASGYCICDDCLAWDHPDGELRTFVWQGISQRYVAMSDRQVNFANALGQKLEERYPDEDYYVRIMAYGNSRPVPVEAVPRGNVVVSTVGNFLLRPYNQDRGSPEGTLHREQFQGWGEVAENLIWRPNKTRRMISMPHIPVEQTIADFRFVAEHGCIGIYIDRVYENWSTRGPLYYVMAQMAWDPWQDGEELLADYYMRGFGGAADDMRAYWELMEEKCRETWENPGLLEHELFDDDFFRKASAHLDNASASVEDTSGKYGERVEFVRKGLEYTQMIAEVRMLMERFKESDGEDKAAEDRARKIWVEKIKPLATDKDYPHALLWHRMRPGQGHSAGLPYPEDLHRRW